MDRMNEPFELRARKLYQEDEANKLLPGDDSTANRRQVRAMQDAVGKARAEGRMTISDARAELVTLRQVALLLDKSPGPVPVRLCAADREFTIRRKSSAEKRQRRRAERQARAAGRKLKSNSKSKKRRR